MLDDFMIRATLAGVGVALAAAPLGCFVVWRRMAYFGDTLAHSALLGVAFALYFDSNVGLTVLLVCVFIALCLVALQRQKNLASDTLLGILAHSSLALGMVLIALMNGINIDLMSYLFGDILAISRAGAWSIFLLVVVLGTLLRLFWQPLLMTTLDEDLAHVEGYPVFALRLLLMIMVALVIAVAMKIIGILLLTSLLIIPAAAARCRCESPEHMACYAALLGASAVVLGLMASLWWDLPSGPAIVLAESILFLGHLLLSKNNS